MSKTATREAYGKALAGLISKRKDIIVLDADLSKSTKTSEAKAVCPNQHFNMGIAEANMMGVAAGLAASGKTVFAALRCLRQAEPMNKYAIVSHIPN